MVRGQRCCTLGGRKDARPLIGYQGMGMHPARKLVFRPWRTAPWLVPMGLHAADLLSLAPR